MIYINNVIFHIYNWKFQTLWCEKREKVKSIKKQDISLNSYFGGLISHGTHNQYTLAEKLVGHVAEVKSQMLVKNPWPQVKVFSVPMVL